jgi:hypothetical protein
MVGSDSRQISTGRSNSVKTVTSHGSFADAVAESRRPVQEIAKRLRGLIIDVYPDVVEVPWPKQRIVGYGVGPKKMSEHFCYIGAHKSHVNLGFYYGADLTDPEGLLEGTGKKFRHLKVRDIEEVDRPPVRRFLEVSVQERRRSLGER